MGAKPMYLIMLPVLLMVGVGSLYNAMINSGFLTTGVSGNATDILAPQYTDTGCNAATSYCTFTDSTTFPFLNDQSPFTKLISGDVQGFLASWFVTGAGPLGVNSTSTIVQSGIGVATNLVLFTGNYNGGSICPAFNGVTFTSIHYGTNYVTSARQFQCNGPTAPTINMTFPLTFTSVYWDGSFSSTADPSSWTIFSLASYNYLTADCTPFSTNATDIQQMICSNFVAPVTSTTSTTVGSLVNFSSVGLFFQLIAGFILLIMSLGIGGSAQAIATGFSFIPNDQGTKFAQLLGIGLIMWVVIQSEFSAWLSSSFIGFGIGSMMAIILEIMFFVGIYWQTQTSA